jgi:hypothetical protein
MMRVVSFIVLMFLLLRVTVFMRISVKFIHAILRAEIKRLAFMFSFREGFL